MFELNVVLGCEVIQDYSFILPRNSKKLTLCMSVFTLFAFL